MRTDTYLVLCTSIRDYNYSSNGRCTKHLKKVKHIQKVLCIHFKKNVWTTFLTLSIPNNPEIKDGKLYSQEYI